MEGTESRGLGTLTYTKVPPPNHRPKMRDFWEIFNSPLSVVYLAIFTKYPTEGRVPPVGPLSLLQSIPKNQVQQSLCVCSLDCASGDIMSLLSISRLFVYETFCNSIAMISMKLGIYNYFMRYPD